MFFRVYGRILTLNNPTKSELSERIFSSWRGRSERNFRRSFLHRSRRAKLPQYQGRQEKKQQHYEFFLHTSSQRSDTVKSVDLGALISKLKHPQMARKYFLDIRMV